MFRVPASADAPTFDHTFKVGFFRWLSSNGTERIEWARRRNQAAQLARLNQNARTDAFVQERIAGVVEKAENRARENVASGKMTQEVADEAVRQVREAAAHS